MKLNSRTAVCSIKTLYFFSARLVNWRKVKFTMFLLMQNANLFNLVKYYLIEFHRFADNTGKKQPGPCGRVCRICGTDRRRRVSDEIPDIGVQAGEKESGAACPMHFFAAAIPKQACGTRGTESGLYGRSCPITLGRTFPIAI